MKLSVVALVFITFAAAAFLVMAALRSYTVPRAKKKRDKTDGNR